MSNLNNLIDKIKRDCENEAADIIATAKAEAAAVIKRFEDDGRRESETVLQSVRAEAQKASELIVLSKRLELRDKGLEAKRDAIDAVFKAALEQLNGMSKPDYVKFLADGLAAIGADAGELILPAKYGITAEEINGLLEKSSGGKHFGLTLYNGARTVAGGFILIAAGVEYNRTFETLLSYRRNDLEADIINLLF